MVACCFLSPEKKRKFLVCCLHPAGQAESRDFRSPNRAGFLTIPSMNTAFLSTTYIDRALGRSALFLSLVAIGWLTLSGTTQAVTPPPDGGYPGGNTAEGQNALLGLTTGTYNTAVGFSSLKSNTMGSLNTAIGVNALSFNTTGVSNTANGSNALYSNTTGERNTASGIYALFLNTTGGSNTANGAFALFNNTTGFINTATGERALFSNISGSANTANGVGALQSNTIGSFDTAVGNGALVGNTSGSRNTALGFQALANGNGTENTAVGSHARVGFGGGGTGNTAVGFAALFFGNGSLNTAMGRHAGYNLTGGDSNNIDIGANVEGVAGESNTIRIGNTDIADTFISGISGTTVASGAAVLVDSDGHLGTVTSSKRFKEEITPMNKTSEEIFSLQPVTFRYKKEIDPAGTSQFGLIAEEVAKVNPNLVVLGRNGKPYTVRYEAVNAMLLNEFLKAHRKIQELEASNAQQQRNFAEQQKQIEALTAGLQKVSAQLEVIKAAPQTVLNND